MRILVIKPQASLCRTGISDTGKMAQLPPQVNHYWRTNDGNSYLNQHINRCYHLFILPVATCFCSKLKQDSYGASLCCTSHARWKQADQLEQIAICWLIQLSIVRQSWYQTLECQKHHRSARCLLIKRRLQDTKNNIRRCFLKKDKKVAF